MDWMWGVMIDGKMLVMRWVMVVMSPVVFTGCISGMIAGSGKSYRHLEDTKVGVEEVRKELGAPVYSRAYRPSKRIMDTPEYRARAAEYKGYPPVVISRGAGDGSSYGEERVVSSCEVYRPKGWYSEEDTQAYGMIGGMTLGVGDVAMIPTVLANKASSMKEGIAVTFWYDANGRYVATYKGDIAKARVKESGGE